MVAEHFPPESWHLEHLHCSAHSWVCSCVCRFYVLLQPLWWVCDVGSQNVKRRYRNGGTLKHLKKQNNICALFCTLQAHEGLPDVHELLGSCGSFQIVCCPWKAQLGWRVSLKLQDDWFKNKITYKWRVTLWNLNCDYFHKTNCFIESSSLVV